jgi:hypothetical protein
MKISCLAYCQDLGLCMIYKRVLDWMIGFIDTLYFQLITRGNYNAIAISTFYCSLLHPLLSPVYYTLYQSFPGNGFVTVSL